MTRRGPNIGPYRTRPFSRRKLLHGSAAVGAGAAGLTLIGCGDDDDDAGQTPSGNGNTPENGSTPDQSSDPTPSGDAQRGGTWRRGAGENVALTGLPYTDAGLLFQGGNAAFRGEGLIFGTLVRVAEGETVEFVPDHAEEWEWSEDRQSITFRLRQDIQWHSGRQFNAQDVAFNLDEITKERWATSHAGRLNPVESYEVVDDFTIRLDLVRPDALALEFAYKLRLADMETIDQIQDGELIGTGAFRLDRFSPVQGATLVANEEYHLGAPLLDSIEYTVFDDPAALAIALETGEIHDSGLPPEEAERHYESGQFEVVTLPPQGGTTPIGIRADIPPTDDQRVRQAIGYLIDRERYKENNFIGRFDEIGRLYWPEFMEPYDAELDEPIYDPDRSRDLLREAGYADGLDQPVTINTLPARPYSPAIAQLLQQEGAAIGIDFQFEPLEYSVMLERYYAGELDNMWIGFGDSGSVLSPAAMLLFNTLTDGAVVNYENQEYLDAWDSIVNGGDDYATYNELFIDGAFNHVLARSVGVNFETDRIHYVRDALGNPVWHKMWVSD